MNDCFWEGFEKRGMDKKAIWGAVIKPITWLAGKAIKNPMKSVGAGLLASDARSAAGKGIKAVRKGKRAGSEAISTYNAAKLNVGTPTF